jgi:hypothetical protein
VRTGRHARKLAALHHNCALRTKDRRADSADVGQDKCVIARKMCTCRCCRQPRLLQVCAVNEHATRKHRVDIRTTTHFMCPQIRWLHGKCRVKNTPLCATNDDECHVFDACPWSGYAHVQINVGGYAWTLYRTHFSPNPPEIRVLHL